MTGFSLKDHLFNRSKVSYLAKLFRAQDAEFPERTFVSRVMKRLPELELKQRIELIAEVLQEFLPSQFPTAARKIVACLPPPLDPDKTDDDFGDFIFAPLGELVVRQGLSQQHLDLSLNTLREITQRFSMEDAARAFIRKFPEKTLEAMRRWMQDPHYHVRRLVSESTRPLLPWSGRIDLPVTATLPLLDELHADPTRYVTRSVANHLNDIAKTEPELVIAALLKWRKKKKQSPAELEWITRHATRTLIKQGHPGALGLQGFHTEPQITVGALRLRQRSLLPGDTLQFSFDITANRAERLVIDYAIDFVKAGNKRSTKIFKAAKLDLESGESRTVTKNHKLHAQATTYQLYPGKHQITLQINGQPHGTASFQIVGTND